MVSAFVMLAALAAGSGAHLPRASCDGVVPGQAPAAGPDDVAVGPVYLQGARNRANDDSRMYVRRHGRDPTAKVPVVVEPGTRVVLRVERPYGRFASLSYRERTRAATRVAGGDHAVRFVSCFDRGRTGWAGGFLLKGPGCVRIRLEIAGRARPAHRLLRFGRRSCA
jgi:hypothetical protein